MELQNILKIKDILLIRTFEQPPILLIKPANYNNF